jgi:hypothetical protein
MGQTVIYIWDLLGMMLCCWVNSYHFGDHIALIFNVKQSKIWTSIALLDIKDEGAVIPLNVRNYPPNNTASLPRRLESSATLLWSPQISQAVVTRMVFCVHLMTVIWSATCYRVARKKADTASTDFHQQNAVSSTPMGQSRVWMEIKGQSSSGQVTVGEDTTVLIKAVLPGDIKCHNWVLFNMSQPTSHNYPAVSLTYLLFWRTV